MKRYAIAGFIGVAAVSLSFLLSQQMQGGGGYPVGGTQPPTPRMGSTPSGTTAGSPATGPTAQSTSVFSTPAAGSLFAPIQPIDLTNPQLLLGMSGTDPLYQLRAIDGIKLVHGYINRFTNEDAVGETGAGILVRGGRSARYDRPSTIAVKLVTGTILVSVRRPSRFALIETPNGVIALDADGDALVTYRDGLLRIDNLSALHNGCKVQIDGRLLEGAPQIVALATGFELVAGQSPLTRADIRPRDGTARRSFVLLANGRVGVNELSVESCLQNNSIIAAMASEPADQRESRIVANLTKMAAVLNVTHGAGGYVTETGLAAKDNGKLN